MKWENEKEYRDRSDCWDNLMPSALEELLDDAKISTSCDWLSAQAGLRLSRRIATCDYLEFDDDTGADPDLCKKSEAFMLTLSPNVVRGWGGEWQVYPTARGISYVPSSVWAATCARRDPDSPRDPVYFKLMRLDDKGLPPRAITPRLVSAKSSLYAGKSAPTKRPLRVAESKNRVVCPGIFVAAQSWRRRRRIRTRHAYDINKSSSYSHPAWSTIECTTAALGA